MSESIPNPEQENLYESAAGLREFVNELEHVRFIEDELVAARDRNDSDRDHSTPESVTCVTRHIVCSGGDATVV